MKKVLDIAKKIGRFAVALVVIAFIFGIADAVLGFMTSDDPADYGRQGFLLGVLRVMFWFIIVVGYAPMKALLEEDDVKQDWARINDGNTAVGLYRGLELLGVSVAAALLIAQI